MSKKEERLRRRAAAAMVIEENESQINEFLGQAMMSVGPRKEGGSLRRHRLEIVRQVATALDEAIEFNNPLIEALDRPFWMLVAWTALMIHEAVKRAAARRRERAVRRLNDHLRSIGKGSLSIAPPVGGLSLRV